MTFARLRHLSLALVFLCVHPDAKADEPVSGVVQGLWFGDSELLKRKVLIVYDDKLVVVTATGGFESGCQFREASGGSPGEVDVNRYDGKKQLGIFEVKRDTLFLLLADPEKPRPSLPAGESLNGKKLRQYTFKRRPTEEGLRVLGKYLSDGSQSSSASRTDV